MRVKLLGNFEMFVQAPEKKKEDYKKARLLVVEGDLLGSAYETI